MNRNTIQMSLIALSMGLALATQVQAQGASNVKREAAMARLATDTGNGAQVSMHSATGTARFVRAGQGGALKAQAPRGGSTDAAKRSGSAQFLADYADLFGITNVATELGEARMEKDRHGGTHFTHKQFYQGVPVFGAELKTHFDASHNLVVANGTFVPGINVNPKPSRTADDAVKSAMSRVQADLADLGRSAKLSATQPALMIYRAGLAQGVEGKSHLVWQVEVGNRVDVRDFVYVDAHTGKIVDKISGIHEAKNRRAYDAGGATAPGPNYPSTPFWVEGQPLPTGNTEADNMIFASGEIYDLFKNAFGRDSFNGAGATMDSIFNRGNGCPNASWNGTFISFCPGTTTDDITAHEWGHAYTEYTHGLIYAWQPGALNEAYSDIWGETVDRINGRGGDTPDAARSAGMCTAFSSVTQVTVSSPLAIAGVKAAGSSTTFGPQNFNVSATDVVVVNDGSIVGTTPTNGALNDGCQTPFVNAAAVAGKIAFMDRGICGFAVKVKNAQLNGAIGVIIGNNQGATLTINMGGADPTITIPTLSVSQNDGTAIKANSGVVASLQRGPGPTNSVRWLMGEDSSGFGGAIRDMYNPTCYGNPGKVSDSQYVCAFAGDQGGVHSNSGVPNHAYALLVDGGAYNGQNISPIGLTKAAHIYYRAQSVYQGPASNFADHADAIEQSCRDLTGANLNSLTTGTPSGEVINANDCAQVAKAALAVELRTPPAQCNFQPLLAKSPPPLCPAGAPTSVAGDTFEGGKRGSLKWLLSTAGTTPDFTARNWGVVNQLPTGRTGFAIYASDPDIGTCAPGGDQTGLQRLESPEITIPANATTLRMSFDHWVATEAGWDGGNLKISVNGGAWQLVSAANFVYNPYNATLNTGAQGNTNPMAGQPAFTGSDGGSVSGSWGRSIINLAPYAAPGSKIKLRFEMGSDGCGGTFGWYLDDVSVYSCPTPP